MRLRERIIKKPWSYMIGGILLAILNIALLLFTDNAWRITSGFVYLGGGILKFVGVDVTDWYYFTRDGGILGQGETLLGNKLVLLNLAVISGSLLATLWASELRWKKIKNKRQLLFGLLGGIIMGYGARLSFGCNVGAYFSAIPSMSLHGWVYAIAMFLGAWLGSKILIKYIL